LFDELQAEITTVFTKYARAHDVAAPGEALVFFSAATQKNIVGLQEALVRKLH
jgi:hypothetical protein